MRSLTTLLRLGLIVVVALAFVAEVDAGTYYVRTSGKDSNNGRSAKKAFRTIKKAAAVARAGDTVYVGAGTYTKSASIAADGTASKPIQFIADAAGAKTGDAGNVLVRAQDAFRVDGDNYIQISGFKFANEQRMVSWKSSVGGLLKDCEFFNGVGPIYVKDASVTIENCKIHDNRDDGIRVEGRKSILTVKKCIIQRCKRKGIFIKDAAQVVIEGSQILDNGDHGIRTEARKSSSTMLVRRCRLQRNRDGFHSHGNSRITLENCLIANNKDEGVHIHADSPRVIMSHCTVARNGDDGFEQDSKVKGSSNVTNSVIAFNGDDGLDRAAGTMTHSYNLVFGNRDDNFDGTKASSSEIVSNPKFVSSSDFHLLSASPAIDRGAATSTTDDLEGKVRPFGRGPDIGCYEGGTASDIYYVRTRGRDSNDGTSRTKAFRSINKAASVVQAGDTVYVGAGAYSESIKLAATGTSADPIRFIADTKGSKTGDRGRVVVLPTGANGVVWEISRSDYVTISGFQLSGKGFSGARGLAIASSSGVSLVNCEFESLRYAIYAAKSALLFDNCKFQKNTDSFYTTKGAVYLKNSDFRNNTRGPQSVEDLLFVADNCKFQKNGTGIVIRRPGTKNFFPSSAARMAKPVTDLVSIRAGKTHGQFVDCVIEGNTVGIELAGYSKFDEVRFRKTTNRNNDSYGLLLRNCTLKFDRSSWGVWPVGKNGAGVAGVDSNLVFQDVTLEGFDRGYAVHCEGGTLALLRCKVQKNYAGVSGTGGTFSASDSRFVDNVDWGLQIGTEGKVSKCTIARNGNGMYLTQIPAAMIALRNSSISNNKKYGVYVHNSKLTLNSSDAAHWRISANGIGIHSVGSELRLNAFDVSGNTTYGVSSDQSTLRINDCRLTGNGTGLYATNNKRMEVLNSTIANNSKWGVRLAGRGKFSGTTITGNGTGGIELTNASDSDLSFARTSVTNNKAYGLYCRSSRLTFNASRFGGLTLSGHDYQIYADNASNLSFDAFTVTGGTKYAVYVTNSKLAAKQSTFTGAGTGLGSYQNSSCVLGNCTFNKNTSFGLSISGNATVTDCTIKDNGSGVLFEKTNSRHTVTLSNNTIQNNSDVGVYASDATMTFNLAKLNGTTVTGSKTVFAGFKSALTFDGLTVSGGSQYGIANYGGTIAVNSCTLSGNGIGMYSDSRCSATGSTFTGNTTDGASVLGSATFTNCVFEKNSNGLKITKGTTGAVSLVGSQIKNNTLYGVWCDSCNLTFDSTMQTGWSVQNNGSNFGATASTLAFKGFKISNGTTYGVVSQRGTLDLANCTLTANGTGAYIDADSTLTASGTTFVSNTLYGASVQGKATLRNCTFKSNTHGLQFANMTGGEFKCSGTIISNNSQSGLHLESCTLKLTGNGIDGLTISDNGYGIHGTNSTLVFDGFTSKGNTYGAWLASSDVTMTNSLFTGSTYGLWSDSNTKFNATSSSFTGNTSYGVHLVGQGSFVNCSITNNGNGLFTSANLTDTNLTGTSISDNRGVGLYVNEGSINLSAQTSAKWTIARNGYNIFGNKSHISLTSASITDSTNYGVYAQSGSIALTDSMVTTKGGGVWGLNTTTFSVERTRVSGSGAGTWAIANYDGNLDMRNSVVSDSRDGVYSSGSTKPAKIYNSTIANMSGYGVYVYSGDVTIVNTIIAGANGSYGLYRRPIASVQHTYNLLSGFTNSFYNTSADSTELFRQPRFVNQAASDFRLGKGSPAINAGKDLTLTAAIDLLGNSRPSHKVFELGAYEYMSDAGAFRVIDWKEKK